MAKITHIADKYCRSQGIGYVSDLCDVEISQEEYDDIDLNPEFFEENKELIIENIEKARVFIS
ncbi:MAG: hypothetical protein HQL32_17720 [Planctomycetes bacterium]|nr:hypothetical protein [Planctomycetota bacterium]